MTSRKRNLIAAAVFFALTVAFTWPLAPHATTAFPSAGIWTAGDPELFIWGFDVTAKAVRGALPVPISQMLFWPNGINLLAGYDGPLMLLVGTPLTLLFGNPILAYDIFVLLAIAGSAFSAYLLGFRLTRSWPAALLTGFLYGLSPYILVRAAQHPNLLMIGTMPLLLLAALRCTDHPEDHRSYAWLALASIANAASSWYYAITGLVFVALLLLFRLDVWRKHAARAAVAALIIGCGTAVVALPSLLTVPHESKPADPEFVARMDAQPIDFVLPNALTNVFGGLRQGLHDDPPRTESLPVPNVFERSAYLGIPLLLLVAAFVARRKSSGLQKPGFWITGFIVFIVLALGTQLVADGITIPLPFAALRKIFPFSLARVPNRFYVGALLCAAIMAGDVIARALSAGRHRTFAGRAIAACFGILFVSERIIFPYPIFNQHVSPFYSTLAADGESYAIADLPIPYFEFSEFNYYQIFHGKPVTAGAYYYPAYTAQVVSFIRQNPLLVSSLCSPRLYQPRHIDLANDVWPAFRQKGIRYVIVHNLLLQNVPECSGMQLTIRKAFEGVKPYYADGDITVYRVPADDASDLVRTPDSR